MDNGAAAAVSIHRVNKRGIVAADDWVAAEEPVAFRLLYYEDGIQRSKAVAVTMRTPGDDEALAAGFLFTEGILKSPSQIYKIGEIPGNEHTVLVSLGPNTSPQLNSMERNFYTTSACGICGKASLDAIKTVMPFKAAPANNFQVDAKVLHGLPASLSAQQEVFQSTGGLHAAARFTAAGIFKLLKEDVGRHNALDKLIGAAFMAGELPLRNEILLLSGRASFELVQKAAMAGITMIAAVGAPSSLAVQMAAESGITLVGFLREDRFNIYTHPDRIIAAT